MIPLVASRPPLAHTLAEWAVGLAPTPDDLALASRALLDTVSVGLAARREPILRTVTSLTEEARWATACHVLDFDDLHLPSTTHISTVCVPVAAALGGGARSYLAGAGVMARVGTALGWRHYAAGWHATTTAGAIGAAVTAGAALGLDADGLARAMALAVPAGGGVQRSFGTDAKSLQVCFAAHAGVRAARLAAAGATADRPRWTSGSSCSGELPSRSRPAERRSPAASRSSSIPAAMRCSDRWERRDSCARTASVPPRSRRSRYGPRPRPWCP